VVVGAVGLTTQWSYLNAFIPALVFGAIASAAGVVTLAEIGREIGPRSQTALVFAALVALAAHSHEALWEPDKFVPTAQDEAAGDRLVETLREVDGPVFVPYSPWYAHLAGKPLHTHKMSITDVTNLSPRHCPPPEEQKPGEECVWLPDRATEVVGLKEGLQEKRWDIVILKPYNREAMFRPLERHYRPALKLTDDMMPSQPTGYEVRGLRVWRPIRPMEPPENARVVFDFESTRLQGWNIRGRAWGRGPARGKLARQMPVGGFGGDRLMNSYHGGDKATGTAVSPLFEVDGNELVLRVGGGKGDKVRVELRDARGKVLFTARGENSEILREVRWDVSKLEGQKVRLALVDESTGGWGHLLVDEVWMVR
jgi:hypothetical protein